ncbi:ankyrin repeat-containing protein NPR4-like [Neltuma alba]|uniref:ankyrin repeat-containing protein NPR4-like n=1 Tax=Neltuma alba TaxID=207710 RepID=UPI0010A59E31|nr:ankyrin repeat-containing protein NPR4-like [Prosopis alba]
MRDLTLSALYRAARRGDVQALEHLLQQNASILDNIPHDGCKTPLHISALLNHASFTQVLLNRNGDLATRKDASGRTALHLASAEDNLEAVQALLEFNDEPCLAADGKGRLPLHYAAMRGRTQVVEALVIAQPDSLGRLDLEGNTVFHLCVIYNHFKTLQALVKLNYVTADVTVGTGASIFTLPDRTGNTILHLAVMYMRDEAVRYLLSIPERRELERAQNGKGRTAYDILERSPEDWKTAEMKLIMLTKDHVGNSETSTVGDCFKKTFRWIQNRFNHGGNTHWLDEMRGNLSAASIFISTVTFQALINPPGGFIQQGSSSSEDNNTTSSSEHSNTTLPPSTPLSCMNLSKGQYCPGEALSSFGHQNPFTWYVVCLTISFYASLCVTLLLVSGVPLQNSAAIWILSIGMSLTLFFLALAFNFAVAIMVPDHIYDDVVFSFCIAALAVWVCEFLLLIGLFNALRFLIWIVKKCCRIINKLKRLCC